MCVCEDNTLPVGILTYNSLTGMNAIVNGMVASKPTTTSEAMARETIFLYAQTVFGRTRMTRESCDFAVVHQYGRYRERKTRRRTRADRGSRLTKAKMRPKHLDTTTGSPSTLALLRRRRQR